MSGTPLILPFRFGLNEAVDPKALPPLTLTKGLNCRIDKQGRIRKRFGTSALSTGIVGGGSIAAGVRLIPRGDSVGLYDGTNIYEYSDALGGWSLIDRAPPFEVKWKPLIAATTNAIDCTVGVYGNLAVVVYGAGYQPDYQILVEIRDLVTGTIVKRPTALFGGFIGSYPRVLFNGSKAIVVAGRGATLQLHEIDMTTLAVGSAITLASLVKLSTPGLYDAVMVGTQLHVVYEDGSNILKYGAWDAASSYALVGSIVTVASTNVTTVAIDATAGERTYIAYANGTDTRFAVHNVSTHAQVVAPVQISTTPSRHVAVARFDASNAIVGFDATANLTTEVISSAGTVDTTTVRTSIWTLVLSKFWAIGGRFYIGATNAPFVAPDTGAPAPSNVILECETSNINPSGLFAVPHRVVGFTEPRYATINTVTDYTTSGRFFVTQSAVDSSGVARLATPFRLLPTSTSLERLPTAFNLVEMRTPPATSDAFRTIKIGASVLMSGGQPCFLDGCTVLPAGFFNEPQFNTNPVMSTSGGSMLAGTYRYKAVYEWLDANSILHRSPASSERVPTAVTGSTGKITLTVRCTALSCKQTMATGLSGSTTGQVRIAIFRTEVNGSDFYRLTHEPDVNVVLNDQAQQSVTVVDTSADSNIGGVALSKRPQLYSNNELDEVAPPASITAVSHRGRGFLLDGGGRTLWATKNVTENPLVAPGFNEVLQIGFAKEKNALESLDDTLVALGTDSIDFVDGDGTQASGGPSGWSVRPVQTDVGCINPRSVVRGPAGVFFQSTRGIELLDRGSQITWVGAAVQDTLRSYPTITSAVLVADQHEIRWTCANTGLTAGVVIVFDYVANQWFTRSYTDGATANAVWIDAKLIAGVYTMLSTTGQVYRENQATCLDSGATWVVKDVEVGWLAPSGNIAWQRVKRMNLLGRSVTDHDLTIQIGRDFATAYEQTKYFQSNTDVTAVALLETVRIAHKNQKGQAFRYRIFDAAPTGAGAAVGTGEGGILEGIALLVQPKEGLPRRSASRQAG